MKTTNYRLQTEMENIKPDNQEWFKDYVRQVLESDKSYHAKADYIGLSIQELQNKIDYLSEDIKEMSALKKRLMSAKAMALETVASVLQEYGIDRVEGTLISSLTITPVKNKVTEHFSILDSEALIQLGYCKVIVDEEAVKSAMSSLEGMNEVDAYVSVTYENETIPSKLKVNTRRSTLNHTLNNQQHQARELLALTEKVA